jgi:Leucine-rich repeat (LRR) protein
VEELQGLSACSGLRELVGGSYAWNLPLPTDATRLSALTYLRLFGDVVPPVVWELTTLRRLELCGGEGAWDIPDSLSNLRQLRVLRISGEATEELPAELGTWLPHLEELLVSDTAIRSLPPGLTRVTYLSASAIHQVSEVTHLAALNRLELDTYYLEPPLQPLSQLTALKALSLGLYEDGEEPQQCMLAPLPSLRSLEVRGWKPLQVAQVQGVVVSAQQLTRLCIEVSLAPEEVARLGQVGVLPQLQQLQLGHMPIDSKHDFAHWDASAAIPWLQQQPRLTSLTLVGCPVPGLLLQQLPPQLEELDIRQGAWLTDPPPTVAQLSRLRKLALSVEKHLPAWVSNLSSLEELRVSGWQVAGDWQVLAQLPVLRRVELPQPVKAQALCHAPHSCWSVLVPGAPPNRSVFDD